MRKVLLVVFSLILCFSGYASAQALRAITQDGKVVILNPDGTWRYADEVGQKPDSTSGIKGKSPVELTRGNYVFWLDEKKWRLDKKREEADQQIFSHVKGDAWAMAITERIPIPIASLKALALENAQQVAPDAKITLDEVRRVNGLQVTCLKMAGTVKGIPFTYYGYYHSNSKGTIQLITYTSTALFAEFQDDFTDFLSGLTAK